MTSFDQKLQDWIVLELNLIAEGRLKTIPDCSTLSRLSGGKNKKVWNYVIQHVRSRHTVEKVRRILKVKRLKNEQNNDSITDTPNKDSNFLRQETTILNEKCAFLKTSVSDIKNKILATELTIRELRKDIDKINQKTAFLEMLTLKYKEKNFILSSLYKKLSYNLSNRFPHETVNKTPHSVVLSSRENNDNVGLDYLLSQVLSLVMKKFNEDEHFESSKDVVKKGIDQKLKNVSLSDLIFHLKDQAKMSCKVVLKNTASAIESVEPSKKMQTLSQKQLQDMKMSHVQSVFNVKKIKKEIENLAEVKHSFAEAKIKSVVSLEDPEFPKKQNLFKLVLENEAFHASIKYFEDTLCKVQKHNQALQEKNKLQMLATQDVENLMKTFYKDFDLLWDLLKSVPSTCQEITKFLSFLHSYANEQVFLTMTSDLQEYSLIMEKDLRSRMEMFWSICEENNIIRPALCDPVLPDSDAVWDVTNLPRFYNVRMIANKIKLVKEMLIGNQEDDLQFRSDGITAVEDKYNEMLDMLSQMQAHLKSSDESLEHCSELSNKLSVAVTDWWEQDAQYIHKILCEGKTLKVWQDILKCLSDYE